MKKSTITLHVPPLPARPYSIIIGTDSLSSLMPILKKKFHSYTLAIVTDTTVQKLYGNDLQKKLQKVFSPVHLFSFSAGEIHKTQSTKTMLDHALLRKKCSRNTLILACGGGVVGDMAGYVASTYLRGVPYIQIPTTLLAMVDSSIGGKTGIDTEFGKNTIGAFWQPSAVIINTSYLKTLGHDHIRSGLMEAIKIYLTMRPGMKNSLKKVIGERSETALQDVILSALEEKARIVEHDEKEQGKRMILNFGHTIGHAIERTSNYSLLHGIAVGLGMLVEARISHELGILSASSLEDIEDMLKTAGINKSLLQKWKPHDIIAATEYDKKKQDSKTLYVLLKRIGCILKKGGKWAHPVPPSIVTHALTSTLNPLP